MKDFQEVYFPFSKQKYGVIEMQGIIFILFISHCGSNRSHFGASQVTEVLITLKICSRSSHSWVKRMQTVSQTWHFHRRFELVCFCSAVAKQAHRTTSQAKQRHQKDNIPSFLRQIFQELGKHSFLCSHTDLDNETLGWFRKNEALHGCLKIVLCYCTMCRSIKLPAVVKSSVYMS